MNTKNLPLSTIEEITLEVNHVAQITQSEKEWLLHLFKGYGCVVLSCAPDPNIKQNLIALHSIFGSPVSHHHSDADGIVTVISSGDAAYQGLTGQRFKFHTDGSFLPEPPKVFALQCEIASRRGGLSQIVQAELLYEFLLKQDPQGLAALHDPDAVTIENVDRSVMSRPIFVRDRDRIMMAYRSSDAQLTVTPKPSAQRAFALIQNYAETLENQFLFKLKPHQIMVADNTRILHGRTPVPEDELPKRRLHRLWFDGLSPISDELSFGFLAPEVPT